MNARRHIPGPAVPGSYSIEDPQIDYLIRDHADAITKLQTAVAAAARIITNVSLADGTNTPVAHGLGRPPRWVQASCARSDNGTVLTDGSVVEIRSGTGVSRNDYVVLRATGYGAPVTVDVLVL